MHTFELKTKTLLKVPQGAYVRVFLKCRQQGLTVLSVAVQKRFTAFYFVQIPQPADAIKSIVSITNLSPPIQIP
jgi:hypothetical protein